MKTIFFQGTFDIWNAGHTRAIQEVKRLYPDSRLVMGVNADSLVLWFKKRLYLPFTQRAEICLGVKGVDEVIECHEPAAIHYLQNLKADVYVLTEEWRDAQKESIDWIEANGGEIYFSPRFPDILCSTDIRRKVIEGAEN